MRLLLDSHVLLWVLGDPSRLSTHADESMRDPDAELLVSAASVWEITIKWRLGKLPQARPLITSYTQALVQLRAEELPVRADDALRAGGFEVAHRDPFDRMLAAQALNHGLALVTNDPAFIVFPSVKTLW